MSNPELAKYYLGLPTVSGKSMPADTSDIFTCLDTYTSGNWAWEIADESLVMDNSVACTTVTLYIPGRVLTGRATCPVKEVRSNHINALMDAVRMLGGNRSIPLQPKSQSSIQSNTSQNMTVDQIQNALNINNQPQSTASSPPTSNPDGDLPFYFGPEDPNAPPEVKAQYAAQKAAQQPQTAPQPQDNTQVPSDYDTPQERYKGFSQHQMDRMADFKKRAEVINDDVLRNYIHMWNPNYFHKGHLTPQNIDKFFDWYDRLEKTGC